MPIPNGIQLFDGVVVDRSTGGEVRSTTYADPTPHAAVIHLREILTRAKQEGYRRAILVLDGIYQFAASCGVYVDSRKQRRTFQCGGACNSRDARRAMSMGYLAAVEMRFYLGEDFALQWHLQYNHYPPVSLTFLPVARKALQLARAGDFGTRLLSPNQVLKTVAEVVVELHLWAFLDSQDA